jgi:hypothetical protein
VRFRAPLHLTVGGIFLFQLLLKAKHLLTDEIFYHFTCFVLDDGNFSLKCGFLSRFRERLSWGLS